MTRLLLLVLVLAGCEAGPCEPDDPAGALTWVQLSLGGSIGESALVIGPDGATALVDVGNDRHADDVLAAVEAWTGAPAVDAVVVTHAHADHLGALSALAGKLEVGQVITRGRVHLDDANLGELEGLDALVAAGADEVALCTEAGCALDEPLDLGGPQIHWLAADARDREGLLLDGELEENSRSVVGVLRWGGFSLLFGGDLTGGGKGTPDVETPLAARAPADLWPLEGVDVHQANHHGIRSSSNEAWLDRAFGAGGDHQLIVGASRAYLAAPHQDVLDAVAPRLGGGFVWASGLGSLAGRHERLRGGEGAVIVRVEEDGAYAVRTSESGVCAEASF